MSLLAQAPKFIEHYTPHAWIQFIRLANSRAFCAYFGEGNQNDLDTFRFAEHLVSNAPEIAGGYVPSEERIKDKRPAVRLARLLVYADLLCYVENNIRSATKGVRFEIKHNETAQYADSSKMRSALAEFDLRNQWSSVERWTDVVKPEHLSEPGRDPALLTCNRYLAGFVRGDSWLGPLRRGVKRQGCQQFTVRTFRSGSPTHSILIPGTLRGFDNPRQAAAMVVFGHALLAYVVERHFTAGLTMPESGYLASSREEIIEEIRLALEGVTISSWLDSHDLFGVTPSEVFDEMDDLYCYGKLGTPGRVLYGTDDDYIVDLWSFTWYIYVTLKVNPRIGGAVVNEGALAFELMTQALIDGSSLAPSASIRALRGKTLKHNGKQITDIDALAMHGQQLFLISCKQFTLMPEYSAGDYAAARNARTRIDEALDEWQTKVKFLIDNPVGDNYDFRNFKLEKFVVVPALIFTPKPEARTTTHLDGKRLFFTALESIDQMAATLEMAS
ncbi:hypothetical protein [Clavibacter michiganensis]|uniref:hypothetical protein n=1 Tax=Clavibacter michiganensis TaxID=28447 RepID=UPI00126A464C|nr:hypothetical protein [Clavibacter michiganensis]